MTFSPSPTEARKHFSVDEGTLRAMVEAKHTNLRLHCTDFISFVVLLGVATEVPSVLARLLRLYYHFLDRIGNLLSVLPYASALSASVH